MTTERMEFRTEIKQLLDLMIHSLYSHKEVFLRELISNASDAIDRARYESLTNSAILEGGGTWKIKLGIDKDKGTLTVSDNGIGMGRDEIIESLGTIARSGTKEFLEALKREDAKDNPELIGQFGVGFYSSFMVADKITVISRPAGTKGAKGVKWESGGDGTFTVEEVDKDSRGTDVILHLRDEEKMYLSEWEIRSVVKKYSDFIEHPIVMDVEKEVESEIKKGEKVKVRQEETLNSMKAVWLKEKSEVTTQEYSDFYKHISHDFHSPAKVIHYKAEGTSEFAALMFVPSVAPVNMLYRDFKYGPMLYVKRVRIMDHCEDLIPQYLRFVQGIVDSSDLPLNVSREILQNNRQVDIIKNSVTKKIIDTFEEMKESEYDDYLKIYKEFGRVLKEGIHFDFSRRETIADLLLFATTESEEGKFRTLKEYVADMKEGQEEIYYIVGSSLADAANSPYLEAFRQNGFEVIFMTDDIDDFIFNGFEYKGKKFHSITRGDITLDKEKTGQIEETRKKYEKLIDLIKTTLSEDVKDVRLSGRLTDTVCCLVADEGDLDPTMERLLKAMGQEVPAIKRILELNPTHPLFAAMNRAFEKDARSDELKEYIRLLYDQALVLEGSKPKDPAAFSKAIAKLMVENANK
ncbi:MAG: molecular chaperone HtpG [Syntrophorhabdaceae bacterium]|nr:molecular chaperone HtpG [Syntrophorhabdaceae bacterium]MDD4195445.1 molecular chaperone HtpG [Syntrophorhabdaceae bacterium]